MFTTEIQPDFMEISHKLIERPNKSVYFNHIHNHCEVLLFIRGQANYNIDGQIFTPEPYDLLFIPAATYHYLIPTDTVPYENYVIGFDPSILDPRHYQTLFTAPLMLNIGEDPELMNFFTRLDRYHRNYRPQDFTLCATALIRELLTHCSYQKHRLQSRLSGSVSHIDKIIGYITENIEKPLDAETIAAHFMLSASYVQNLFSQNMHIGLKKYIMQKKIYAAHSCLKEGMSPSQVCEKYGFGDYSSFYRLYRRTFSVSPSK